MKTTRYWQNSNGFFMTKKVGTKRKYLLFVFNFSSDRYEYLASYRRLIDAQEDSKVSLGNSIGSDAVQKWREDEVYGKTFWEEEQKAFAPKTERAPLLSQPRRY